VTTLANSPRREEREVAVRARLAEGETACGTYRVSTESTG
jgi:hypothetical protein